MTATQLRTARHHGLGLTALQCLLLLAEHESMTMTTLAIRIGVSTAAMTGTADRLCKQGLLQRAPSRSDRRAIALTLTELGHARYFQITGRAVERTASLPARQSPSPAGTRHDCGSGHDYGICPHCGKGHGYNLMRGGVFAESLQPTTLP